MRMVDPIHIPARQAWAERNLEEWKADSSPPWGSALCRVHRDSTPSLRVNLETGGVMCQAASCGWQGTITAYAALCNLPTEGLPTPPAKGASPSEKTTTHYVYSRADGTPHLRVTRSDGPNGKRIYQNHWDGREWVKGKPPGPAPLYNANNLAKATAGTLVYMVEGEKCAQHLIDRGLLATTAPEGAGKFKQVGRDWLDLLLPLGVVILPDHDTGGYSHAQQVGDRLRKELAIESKVLLLPGLGPKEDVADWLQLPRRVSDLAELVPSALPLDAFRSVAEATFPKKEPKTHTPPPSKGTRVVLDEKQSLRKAEQMLAAMSRANEPIRAFIWKPTQKFHELHDNGKISACDTPESLGNLLEGALGLSFYTVDGEGTERLGDAPNNALRRLLAMAPSLTEAPTETGPPIIAEFIKAPVLAADGTLIMAPGLHPTGIYYQPSIIIPPVPSDPSPELVAECLEGLDYLIDDFPLEGEEDRQAFYSYLFTGFAAAKAPRPWPLWHFSAPCIGAGKDKLASLPGHIALGRDPGVLPIDAMERSDAEIRKKLTSLLDSSPARWALMGNLKGHLSSASLEGFLTATEWKDRILGGNKMGSWPITVGLAMTGNNLTLSPDLERRQILIRLTPDTDKPWLRNDFQIPDLFGYVKENRAQILWQILVLVQRWVALGFPQGSQRLGSFEGWSAALGGLLECVGIGSKFLASTRVVATHTDPWQAFVQLWAKSYIDNARQPASELCRFVEESGVRLSEGSPAMSLGRKLAKQNGRVFAVGPDDNRHFVRLKNEPYGNAVFWSLEKVETTRNRQKEVPEVPKFQNADNDRVSSSPMFHGSSKNPDGSSKNPDAPNGKHTNGTAHNLPLEQIGSLVPAKSAAEVNRRLALADDEEEI